MNSKNKTKAFVFLGVAFVLLITLTDCKQTSGGGKPTPKHAITFSVEGANGTLKAVVSDKEITSGDEVEEGKTVTFTATANDGYRVKEWKVDGTIIGNKPNIYTHTVTKAVNVTVSFEATPTYAINFSVDGANGTLTAKVDGNEIASGKEVEEGKTVTFTATANSGYRVQGWTLDGSPITEAGTNTEYKLTVSKSATVSVSFEVASVECGAVLILNPTKLNISITAKTADGSAIVVEGCTETTLKSDVETKLHAKGTKVILKGKITELYCYYNQLTELNVQGLTALQVLSCYSNQLTELNVQGLTSLKELYCGGNQLTELNVQGCASLQGLWCYSNQLTALNVQGCTALKVLYCHSNQLTAQAMTELLEALPARKASDDAKAVLYIEYSSEGNCKDFTQSEDLKAAFDEAKTNKHWNLQKVNASGLKEDL